MHSSVYINTWLLARGDLILPVYQLISNLLTWIGNLKFKKIQIRMQSGWAEFDPGESVLQLLVRMGEWVLAYSLYSMVSYYQAVMTDTDPSLEKPRKEFRMRQPLLKVILEFLTPVFTTDLNFNKLYNILYYCKNC